MKTRACAAHVPCKYLRYIKLQKWLDSREVDEVKTYLDQKLLSNNWKQWLAGQQYKSFLTVTTESTYGDNQYISYVNQALYFLNRRIFGRKFKKHGEFIEGFAMCERHDLRKHTYESINPKYISKAMIRNPLHMHLLINDTEELNSRLGDRDFEALIMREFGRVRHRTKHGKEYPVFNEKGLDFQSDIYEKERLVDYVTKTARFDSDYGFVGILGVDGVVLGGNIKH